MRRPALLLPGVYREYAERTLLYVHGNHDQPEHTASGQTLHRPGGWVNVDGRAVLAGDVIIAGLGGSIRYKPHSSHQYTERQMVRKVWRMMPSLEAR